MLWVHNDHIKKKFIIYYFYVYTHRGTYLRHGKKIFQPQTLIWAILIIRWPKFDENKKKKSPLPPPLFLTGGQVPTMAEWAREKGSAALPFTAANGPAVLPPPPAWTLPLPCSASRGQNLGIDEKEGVEDFFFILFSSNLSYPIKNIARLKFGVEKHV